ncbi:P-loop NTPase fold protein, partial [Klebsiella pneumoniae]|uniref:P-loop NTPase fold protein n=1 Tax=Klebsiella pneumoniae TaxID=573 RepID=UPI0038F5D90B
MPITKILDNFLISEEKVAVLKGEWGVGKTHFWKRYYAKQIAYAYVSLFGVNSINEIKKEIYQNTVPINNRMYRETIYNKSEMLATKLISSVPRFLKYNKVTKSLFKYFGFDINFYGVKSSGISSSLEYSFVNGYLICFDDLERKGNSLELKDFMGLIDNLARDKNCKVVLIFNEKNLKSDNEERLFN